MTADQYLHDSINSEPMRDFSSMNFMGGTKVGDQIYLFQDYAELINSRIQHNNPSTYINVIKIP
jgi:hypothetical protein